MSADRDVFPAPVLRADDDWLRTHYIPIPPEVVAPLLEAGVRRIIVRLNDGPEVRRAIQRRGGAPVFLINQKVLRQIQASEGDVIMVALWPDPEPDRIDVGEELTAALDQDEAAAARYHGLTPGKQRGLAYYVNSAKRVETRVKRALEVAEKLRTFTLYGDRDAE